MPFQAVAWAWQHPLPSPLHKLALIWLAKEADEFGLLSPADVSIFSEFAGCTFSQACQAIRDLGEMGLLDHDEGFSILLAFPLLGEADDQGYVANRAPLDPRLRDAVVRDAVCFGCGDTTKLEADHILPRAIGGSNEESNLQPLCRVCNGRKGSRIGWVSL